MYLMMSYCLEGSANGNGLFLDDVDDLEVVEGHPGSGHHEDQKYHQSLEICHPEHLLCENSARVSNLSE